MSIASKRVYEKPAAGDGVRILVDGLWPRGFSKEKLKVEAWMKELAPSAALRSWYGHNPEKWEEFRKKYRDELSKPPRKALLEELAERARAGPVTIIFAARDTERSNAAVLVELIREMLGRRKARMAGR